MPAPHPAHPAGAPTRRLTVCRRSLPRARSRYVAVPELRICGRWLEAQGFCAGETVAVICAPGRLITSLSRQPGLHSE